ncbi:MAG: DoxX family protein [Pseudomonadota bacterium]
MLTERAQRRLETAGRAGLASLFVLGGINKIMNYPGTLERMTDVGLSPAGLLLPLTIALELGGGLALIVGVPALRVIAGLTLATFTLATNVFFHRFWELDGMIGDLELSLFFKNLAIAGALVMAAGVRRGQVSTA